MLPLGPRLAELTKLKLEYNSAKSLLKGLQHELACLDERLSPTDLQADKDRMLLIQEKEQLLGEFRVIRSHSKDPLHIKEYDEKIAILEHDLTQTLEVNSKADEERIQLQEQKQELVNRLRETIRVMVKLEGQLRSISASTLSVSSSSSLGSLSTSSKGSLSSLSFTDIYGSQQYSSSEHVALNMSDLHRRVEKLLKSNYESDRNYAEKLKNLEENSAGILSRSTLSLSPRSSLSSLSPPTSSCEPLIGVDFASRFTLDNTAADSAEWISVQERLAELRLRSECSEAASTSSSTQGLTTQQPILSSTSAADQHNLEAALNPNNKGKDLTEYELSLLNNRHHGGGVSRLVAELMGTNTSGVTSTEEQIMAELLSSTHASDDRLMSELLATSSTHSDERLVAGLIGSSDDRLICTSTSAGCDDHILYEMGEEDEDLQVDTDEDNHRTISAAVSDESVAGDSGVYEACSKGSSSPEYSETPQVQIKLK